MAEKNKYPLDYERRFGGVAKLYTKAGAERLKNAHVCVVGLVGVGSWAAEALARTAVGRITLVDNDTVAPSNCNRQLVALHSTIGQPKAAVMAARLRDINPDIKVTEYPIFYMPENADQIDLSGFDCIVDAIDTVTAKLHLIQTAKALGVPIISSMGAGNKFDPTAFQVADIYKTSVCPLAKVMRRELKKRGIKKLKVVYSQEKPTRPIEDMSISCRSHCICPPDAAHKCTERRDIPGSTAFVPSVVGLIIAGEVIKDLARA